MNLAFAVFKYKPFGGMQKNLLRIALACEQRGHSITVFCETLEGELPASWTVHCLPNNCQSNHAKALQFSSELAKAARQQRFDLLIGFNRMPGLDVYYAGDTCFALKAFEEKNWLYRIGPRSRGFMQLESAVFGTNSHTRILAVSEQQIPIYQQYWHTPASRFYPLPPGISRQFHPAGPRQQLRVQYRKKLQLDDNIPIALMVGSGFKTKGVERAIKALQHMQQQGRELQLIVIGEDKLSAYRRRVKRLGIEDRVNFIGLTPDVQEYMWAADFLIHPAVRENTGNVIIEAMTAGLPVIASGVCGYAHYLEEADAGTVLSEPFQQAQLNQALLTMTNCDRGQMSANGIQFGQTENLYSRADYVAQLLETFGGRDD